VGSVTFWVAPLSPVTTYECPATGGHSSSEFRIQSSELRARYLQSAPDSAESLEFLIPLPRECPPPAGIRVRSSEFRVQNSELVPRASPSSNCPTASGTSFMGRTDASTVSPSGKTYRTLPLPPNPGFDQMVKILQLSGPQPPRRKKPSQKGRF
jgi:hypothetical protein